VRSSKIETRTRRAKLPVSKKPLYDQIAPGVSIGYRKNQGAGTWTVRVADGAGSSWTKRIGTADDHADPDGETILDYWQAVERCKALARGSDVDAGRPATVGEAVGDYADDLAVRGADGYNATRLLVHVPPSLLAKTVAVLTVRELRHWRNGLLDKKLKPTTVNRMSKALKAALNLAAGHDDRINNAKAWTVGLSGIPESDNESNVVLSDKQVAALIKCAYRIGQPFGLWCETLAVTGARTSQITELTLPIWR
jgi:hypothetical protein